MCCIEIAGAFGFARGQESLCACAPPLQRSQNLKTVEKVYAISAEALPCLEKRVCTTGWTPSSSMSG